MDSVPKSIITKVLAFCFTSCAIACVFLPPFIKNQWILPFPFKIIGLSNNSHPGYDIHYIIVVAILGYIYFLQLGYDLCFYYFSIFVAFRMDICKDMAGQIGDDTLSYVEQRQMLVKTINLHMDTTRWCFAAECTKCEQNGYSRRPCFFFCRFIKDCSVTVALVIFFQSAGTLLMVTVCLYTWAVVILFLKRYINRYFLSGLQGIGYFLFKLLNYNWITKTP